MTGRCPACGRRHSRPHECGLPVLQPSLAEEAGFGCVLFFLAGAALLAVVLAVLEHGFAVRLP